MKTRAVHGHEPIITAGLQAWVFFDVHAEQQTGVEVLGQEWRRRWSGEEPLTMVRESLEPKQSVSVVTRSYSQLFH